MDAVAEKLEKKLHEWQGGTSQHVRALVEDIIAAADEGTLEFGRSRAVEQEVLDLLDNPPAR